MSRHWPEPARTQALVALGAVEKITGLSKSGVYRAIREQLLTPPVKLGRASRWPELEVLAVQAAMLRGDDLGARQALVRQLRVQRGAAPLTLLRR